MAEHSCDANTHLHVFLLVIVRIHRKFHQALSKIEEKKEQERWIQERIGTTLPGFLSKDWTTPKVSKFVEGLS